MYAVQKKYYDRGKYLSFLTETCLSAPESKNRVVFGVPSVYLLTHMALSWFKPIFFTFVIYFIVYENCGGLDSYLGDILFESPLDYLSF
jgi:hypothetical protein